MATPPSPNSSITSPWETQMVTTPVVRPGPEDGQVTPLSLQGTRRPARAPGAADLTTSAKNIILTEAGRSPWYSKEGVPRSAYVIGVAGGSASGKTSVSRRILASLPNVPWVAIVSQDSFYLPLTPEQSALAFKNQWNFDSPRSFDQDLFKKCIADLKASKAVEIPVYSFVHHQRLEETTYLYGPSVIIVEGLFVLDDPGVRDLLDLKVFVQADSDVMLARRIMRDTKERGRDVHGVIEHYLKWVKPAVDSYIAPTSKWADLIVPGQNNDVAVDIVSQHVKRQLEARTNRFRSALGRFPVPVDGAETSSGDASMDVKQMTRPPPCSRSSAYWVFQQMSTASSESSLCSPTNPSVTNNHSPIPLPTSVHLLPPTPQLVGLLTILHDSTTSPEDFIFYTDRICSLVVEEALSMLPYKDSEVVCGGTGLKWMGKTLDVENICSVSILRSGSVFEKATRQAIPALPLGSLLIQSCQEDGEPQLYSLDLPLSIRRRSRAEKCHVLLLDPQVSTGAAAFMALRVLLDHGVPEQNIIFLSVLASARGGLWALAGAFPQVRIVLAGVDPGLKKLRMEYPRPQIRHHQPRRASTRRLTNGQELVKTSTIATQSEHAQLPSPVADEDEEPSKPKGKTIWAITPGVGSIGDRYFRTD